MENVNFLNIYLLEDKEKSFYNITPADSKREWMNEDGGWSYNCLPLKIANKYGWFVRCPYDIEITWDGIESEKNFTVNSDNEEFFKYIDFNFGNGTLTFMLDFIIKSSIGDSLYVRGISNNKKELIYPLDGIVETDWLPFTFSFSYKFLKAGAVKFKKDEPIFMFFPIKRNYIENFDISYKFIGEDQVLKEQRNKFNQSRNDHNDNIINNKRSAQKFYIKGAIINEKINIQNHKINLILKQPENRKIWKI